MVTVVGFFVYRWPHLCHMHPEGCLQDRHLGQGLSRPACRDRGLGTPCRPWEQPWGLYPAWPAQY